MIKKHLIIALIVLGCIGAEAMAAKKDLSLTVGQLSQSLNAIEGSITKKASEKCKKFDNKGNCIDTKAKTDTSVYESKPVERDLGDKAKLGIELVEAFGELYDVVGKDIIKLFGSLIIKGDNAEEKQRIVAALPESFIRGFVPLIGFLDEAVTNNFRDLVFRLQDEIRCFVKDVKVCEEKNFCSSSNECLKKVISDLILFLSPFRTALLRGLSIKNPSDGVRKVYKGIVIDMAETVWQNKEERAKIIAIANSLDKVIFIIEKIGKALN